jgi:hypothetical protein
MSSTDNIEDLVVRLTAEFEGVLSAGMVAESVRSAVPRRVAAERPDALEETARADLTELAEAVTRGGGSHDAPVDEVLNDPT